MAITATSNAPVILVPVTRQRTSTRSAASTVFQYVKAKVRRKREDAS
jgi:hypothetical protein